MDPKQLHPQPGFFEQMALALNLEDEPAETGSINPPSPEEARLRSEAARQLLEADGAVWMAEYQQLRDTGWPWRVAAYIAWAASPRIGRKPETLAELATKVLGLTGPRQIHHWRETNPSINAVGATLPAAPLMEHRRDVLQALVQSASSADHRSNPDRKLYLEMIGEYVPHSKIEVSRGEADDLSTYSDDELERKAKQARARSRQEPASD
jgi:hypothetical protein